MHILLDENFSKNLAAAKRGPTRDSLPHVAEAMQYQRALRNQ